MSIANRISDCDDGMHRMRSVHRVFGVTMHHFDTQAADVEPSVVGIADYYRRNRQWTNGQMPYTFGVHPTGCVEQALPLREVGPHALRWSQPTVSVVWLGAFSRKPPTAAAWHAAAELVADICLSLDLDPRGRIPVIGHAGSRVVAGHTERPGATRDKDKVCPGRAVSMSSFRDLTCEYQRNGAIQRLASAGVVS